MNKNTMRYIFIFLFFIISIVKTHSQKWNNVPIDGKLNDFKLNMSKRGFSHTGTQENMAFFDGKINNEKYQATAVLTPISKIVYGIILNKEAEENSWNTIKFEYYKYKDILVEKYGSPSKNDELFEYPFKEGDGMEINAVMSDKVKYQTIWRDISIDSNLIVILTINKNKRVYFWYCNKTNNDINDAENDKIIKESF